jgi:Flp pilus assembly pilin Flp
MRAVDLSGSVCRFRERIGGWDVIRSRRVRTDSLDGSSEAGQTMAEYAVLLGLLIVAVAATMTVFSTGVNAALGSHITVILTGV